MTTRSSSDTPATDPDTGHCRNGGPQHSRTAMARVSAMACPAGPRPIPPIRRTCPTTGCAGARRKRVLHVHGQRRQDLEHVSTRTPRKVGTPRAPGRRARTIRTSPSSPKPGRARSLLGLAVTAHADAYTVHRGVQQLRPTRPCRWPSRSSRGRRSNVSANSKLTSSVTATGDPVHYEWRKRRHARWNQRCRRNTHYPTSADHRLR